MRRSLVGLCLSLIVTFIAVRSAQAQSGGGGGQVKPYAQTCGGAGNPCMPKAYVVLSGLPTGPLAPESTYTYQATISNVGSAAGLFGYGCAPSNPQLTCAGWDASTFPLDIGEANTVTITMHAVGLGSGYQTVTGYATVNGDAVVDSRSAATSVYTVAGTSIFTRIWPFDGGSVSAGDSLTTTVSHPSGIVTASLQTWLDGVLVTSGIRSDSVPTGRRLTFAPTLAAGTHTWRNYGCTVSGRCDSMYTTLTEDALASWNMDDSLPQFVGTTGMGGVGPLAIPPDSLRGCPRLSKGIDLRITEPATTVAGQGSGTAFVAAYITTPNSLRISLAHVQNQDASLTCDNGYWFVPPDSFNYGWWQTDYYHGFFAQWPYEAGGYVMEHQAGATVEQFAEVPDLDAPSGFLPFGPNRFGAPRGVAAGGGRLHGPLLAHLAETLLSRRTLTSHRAATRAMVPDPGAVDTMSTTIYLNGTLIVRNDSAVDTITTHKVSGWKGGSTWTIKGSAPIVNIYHDSNPSADSGGWNELIVGIATTDGKWSYMRSRFVLGPPEIAPTHAQVAAMRAFDHASTSDCPAFGSLQCGSLFLTEAVPGFVSRDRERSLALVYRSSSQRVPTLFPIRYLIDRYHKKPDSLHVRLTVNGDTVYESLGKPRTYRFAGDTLAPIGINTPIMEAGVTADRVIGVEVPAASSGDAAIVADTNTIQSYYAGGTVITDVVATNVVQLFNTTTGSSRFGAGWSVSALQRLYHGLTWGTDNAKILATADGSYLVFRQSGSGPWRAPAGSTARLLFRTSADSGAKWIVSLDDGTRMGFFDAGDIQAGRLAWTEDLIGNRTYFYWGRNTGNSTGADSLLAIKDPTGAQFSFKYGAGTGGSLVRSIWAIPATGGSGHRVDSLAYDASGRLAAVRRYKTATAYDSTMYYYHAANPAGALIDSIVDPRSKSTNRISELVAWDTISWTPSQLQTPVWSGTTRYSTWFRDVWRRATPRANYGRTSTQPLERMVTPDQLRGSFIDLHGPVDFRVDRFNGTAYVRRPAPDSLWAVPGCSIFCFSTSAMDQIRDIERDTLTGQVTKIVVNRSVGPSVADSVMYRYDPTTLRVTSLIRPSAGSDSGQSSWIDTVRFQYDIAAIAKPHFGVGTEAADSASCVRLRLSLGVHHDSTTVSYGGSGVGQCLPTAVTEPGHLTTTLAYGPLTLGDHRTTRPMAVTGPDGVTAMTWISTSGVNSWNTDSGRAGGIVTHAFYNALGRPDSTVTGSGTGKTGTQFLYDSLGRVTFQRTGWGNLAPVTATYYGPSGLVDSLRVYAALSNSALQTPISNGRIELTRYFYNRFGGLDSTLAPGPRTGSTDTLARKQSFRRLPNGLAGTTFPGNGSWVTRVYDVLGNLKYQTLSASSPTAGSGDGERFAAPYTYPNGFDAPDGSWTHLGSAMIYGYDVNNKPIWNIAYDVFTHDTTMRASYLYDAQGKLTDLSRYFSGRLATHQRYTYNRRGQPLVVSDTVWSLSGSPVTGEVGGKQLYSYDDLTGRLLSVEARVSGNGVSNQPYARLTFTYDSVGRIRQRGLQLYDTAGGTWGPRALVTERYGYSGATGRMLGDTTLVNGAVRALFNAADASYTSSGDDSVASTLIPTDVSPRVSTYNYSTDGTRRLIGASTWTGTLSSYGYDAFGNRTSSLGADPCSGQTPSDSEVFAPDNRLMRRVWGTCVTTFVSDQAGNRLAEIVKDNGVLNLYHYHKMSYTALGQLYASGTNTVDPGHYDFNWHWYDADGMRVKTTVQAGVSGWTPTFDVVGNPTTYFIYDGSQVAFTVVGQNGSFNVEKRYVSLGTDAAVAGRFWLGPTAYRTEALLSDHQGNTIGAVRSDGANELTSDIYGRDPFGMIAAQSSGGSVGIGTSFAGGSTPNATGGFTYFRNRWYDPATGRFLTQDPIGMNGGVNLYAYAGNNPVAYSDPYGLCPPCGLVLPSSVVDVALTGGMSRGEVLDRSHEIASRSLLVAGAVDLLASGARMAAGALSRLVGEAAGAAPGTAISTLRETTAGESFSHYSYERHAGSLSGGLNPGAYGTSAEGLSGGQAANGLALPHAEVPDAVYTVTPKPGTLIDVNPSAAPKFGRPGGLPEVRFLTGTGPGTVSGPTPIAP